MPDQNAPATASRADERSRPAPLSMQQIILTLQQFWSERGATIVQPFNTEVGAGTANPATALRVLGPEPWQVAYVEPSVRPDDARYGKNPNRLQTHTQFQVILKPTPVDPQELYLASLAALGIDTLAHDIRFVEDNWASPALGAWGLGWEVWLDGLEITQFTYFQQAGGLTLDPVSVELTYGLERIVMSLQSVSHFTDIRFNEQLTYGEIFSQSEYEMSRYYLDDADVDLNRRLFDEYASEAQRLLELELPVPAYSYVLKCSHTFNVLDARGAIGTVERARSFGLMRRLTKEVSELWVQRRRDIGLPLGIGEPLPPAPESPLPVVTETLPLLVEIGVEELPHTDVRRSQTQVLAAVEEFLATTALAHGAVTVRSTPRRIVVTVADVAAAEAEVTRTVRGPKASIAWNEQGEPTKALLGFLRNRTVDPSEVQRTEINGVEYVTVDEVVAGRTSPEIAAGLVDVAVRALRAERNMRWGDSELSYSRPIRWLVALLGDQLVPATVSSLAAGRSTRVLRVSEPDEVTIPSATDFDDLLAHHGIVLDRPARRALVVDGATALAGSVHGRIDSEGEASLIDEITDLVEDPRPILGSFETRFLELPAAVLTTVMRKHQRYLPVVGSADELLPNFVTVANGPCDEGVVRAGNESVIRARYEDAAFFWRADLEVSPQEFRSRLGALTFDSRLGSFDDRVTRVATLADTFAAHCDVDGDTAEVVARAGALGKFDLASQMVIELSSLAGTMAAEYALRAGESPAVAQALAEMEMPRSSQSAIPASLPGAILSLADRFDLVTSMYAIGSIPTGTSDPFGVRRACLGIVAVLRAFPALSALSLSWSVDRAADGLRAQGIEVSADACAGAVEFIRQRFELQVLDEGVALNVVRAVLPSADRPAEAVTVLSQLGAALGAPGADAVVAALQRIARILPPGTAATADAGTPGVEQDLVAAVERVAAAGGDRGLPDFFAAASELAPVLDRYFEEVLVMDPNPEVRAARLGVLARVAELAPAGIDWTAL